MSGTAEETMRVDRLAVATVVLIALMLISAAAGAL